MRKDYGERVRKGVSPLVDAGTALRVNSRVGELLA